MRYGEILVWLPPPCDDEIVWMSDLTSEGYGREGWGGVGDRPAARNGDVRRGTSYNETCVLLRQESVLCRADIPAENYRPAPHLRLLLAEAERRFG